MGRKLDLVAYISDDTIREATLEHLKNGFMKKFHKLKNVCEVDACAVIFNPSNSNPEPPEVLPSNSKVFNVIQKYEMLTEKQKTWRSLSHEEFLKQEILKVKKKSQKLIEQDKEGYMRMLMFECLDENMGGLSMTDSDLLADLIYFIDHYLKSLNDRKDVLLNNPSFEVGESSSVAMVADIDPTAMPAAVEPPAMFEEGSGYFMDLLQSIISSDQEPEHVNSLATNSPNASVLNSPQATRELQPHDTFLASDSWPNSNEEVYIPVMNQDEYYYPYQNQDEQFVEEMMKLGEQTGFPWMEDNHQEF